MTTVLKHSNPPIKNDNLKNMAPMGAKLPKESAPAMEAADSAQISETAKQLKASETHSPQSPQSSSTAPSDVAGSAASVAKSIAKLPVLPITTPVEIKDGKKLEDVKISKSPDKISFIKKPAVIFVEGFSAFGISNGDGIKDMADNLPGAKRFSWNEKDLIVEEIKKHAPDQPVIMVGHSFGADTAVEIASELNSVKNAFRSIDLLVTIDSVGVNHSIIPMNVKRNLNFFGEGVIPFLHGDPTVARNTDYTDVINELRSELHSRMDDSQEIQYKIFSNINEVLSDFDENDLFEEMQKKERFRDLIDNHLNRSKG